jgi:hypothetical protein
MFNCLFTRGYVAIISRIFLGLLCRFAVVPNWGDTDGSLAQTRTHDHHQPCCRWSHGRCAWAEFAQLPNWKRWPKRGFTGEFRTPNLTLMKNPQLEKMPRDTFDTAHQSPKMPKVTNINQSSFDLMSPVYQVQNLQTHFSHRFFRKETTRRRASWSPGKSSRSSRRPFCCFPQTWMWPEPEHWPTSKKLSRTWGWLLGTTGDVGFRGLVYDQMWGLQRVMWDHRIHQEPHDFTKSHRKLGNRVPRSSTSSSGSEMAVWHRFGVCDFDTKMQ